METKVPMLKISYICKLLKTTIKELGKRSAKKPNCNFSHFLEIEQQSRVSSGVTGLAWCLEAGLALGGSWRAWWGIRKEGSRGKV